MDSPCIKQTVCKVLKIFQYGKYLVAYVLKGFPFDNVDIYRGSTMSAHLKQGFATLNNSNNTIAGMVEIADIT